MTPGSTCCALRTPRLRPTTRQPPHVATAIELLRSEFDFVVIDTGAGLDEHCLAAIERSTDLVFVGSTDVAGVRNVRKEIDVLDRMDFTSAERHLVLNRADAKVGLDPERHRRVHRHADHVLMPSSRLVPLSNNEGAPLLGSDPKSPVSRSLAELVGRFSGLEQSEAAPTASVVAPQEGDHEHQRPSQATNRPSPDVRRARAGADRRRPDCSPSPLRSGSSSIRSPR